MRSSLEDRRNTGDGAGLIDPDALMRIRSLELRARVVVEGFLRGLHRSTLHGFSVEFSEYRQYTPGDDPRQLDWRVYARTDRHYVRRFEDETNLRCYLLLDTSRSMSYGTLAYSKGEYARTAAATLAWFLSSQRDAVGLLTFDEDIVDYLPARYRPGHLHRIIRLLERPHAGTSTNLAAPLERIARIVTKRSLVVLVSDLLAPLEALEQQLRALRARGHEVVVLRVLDPAEESFGFTAPSIFRDVESGRDIYVDPESARSGYLRRFGEHTAAVTRFCAELGIDLHRFATDRPLELALLEFVASRLRRRGARVARAEGRTAAGRRGT
jgi:uncharacterized protein (DUF58 family)